jgi:hypothetical protein
MIDLDAIKARLARVWGRWPTKGVLAPGADEFGPKAWSAHGPLRCHATPQGRARQWTQANADAAFIAAAPADIGALVAEVERLRSINDDYLLEMGRQHALLRDQKRGENAERAAVVAWLRAEAEAFAGTRTEQGVQRAKSLTLAADNIERGEHRREEKE